MVQRGLDTISKRAYCGLFFFICILTYVSVARGQWQQIGTIDQPVSIVKFFSSTFGLLGTGSSPGGPAPADLGIYRTTNGGSTWLTTTVPWTGTGELTDFCMMDALRGWASVIGDGNSGLWSTSDGGATWQETSLVASATSVNLTWKALVVTDIFGPTHISTDTARTWQMSSTESQNDASFSSGLFGISSGFKAGWATTSDGGLTWKYLVQGVESWSVYAVPNSTEAFAAPEGSSIGPAIPSSVYYSNDRGNTWSTQSSLSFTTTGHIGCASDKVLFVQESSNANAGNSVQNGFLMSTDLGRTWSNINGPQALNDTRFAVWAGCGDGTVYAYEESYPYVSPTHLYRYNFSYPFARTWISPLLSTAALSISSKGCESDSEVLQIASSPCSAFRLDSIRISNMQLITRGALILNIPPLPKTYQDGTWCPFELVWHPGLSGGFDTTFRDTITLYTTDPTNGKMHDTTIALALTVLPFDFGPPHILSNSPDSISSTLCTSIQSGFRLESDTCSMFTLNSIRFSNQNLVQLGTVGFEANPKLPKTYANGESDSIGFFWNPGLAFQTDTTINDSIILHYTNPATGKPFDTTIAFTLIANHDNTLHSLSADTIGYPPTSTCSSADSLITVHNNGCHTTVIDSVIASNREFTVLSYDSTIDANGNADVHVRYKPDSAKISSGMLYIYLTEEGISRKDSVRLNGFGIQGLGILSLAATKLNASSFSICAGDTTVVTSISNMGCDTLVISNFNFSSDGTMTYASQPLDSLLPPNENIPFSFLFSPRLKGPHTATLTFHARNLHGNDPGHDTTITIFGVGLSGTKSLTVTPPSANFGSMYECESRDTIITLYNTGCDTVHVTGGSFSNPSYTTNVTYPDTLAPGQALVIDVHVDTTLSNGTSTITGIYFVQSDASDTLPPIPFTVNIIPTTHLVLELLQPDSASAGAQVTYILRVVGPHPPNLFSEFQFDLTHDNDLLSFDSLSGNGLSDVTDTLTNGMTTQHFTLLPVPLTDTIGRLTFTVYLAKDSATALRLPQFEFKDAIGLNQDCIASVSDSGSSFTYLYRCGEHSVQAVMRGEALLVGRIVPNPAQNTMQVEVMGVTGDPIHAEVFDALGRACPVVSTVAVADVSVRSTTLQLNVSTLPEGVYCLRISNGAALATGRFTIIR
jgi:hypothetical protein